MDRVGQRPAQGLLGPDGQSLEYVGRVIGPDGIPVDQARVEIEDGTLTYRDRIDGMPVKIEQSQVLIDMARRQRDGASLQAIMAEFGVIGEARNPFILQRAIEVGHELLAKAIAEGREPDETPPHLDASMYDTVVTEVLDDE